MLGLHDEAHSEGGVAPKVVEFPFVKREYRNNGLLLMLYQRLVLYVNLPFESLIE